MKCAVITPVGPGHDLYALDAEDSVKRATAAARGPFADIVFIKVDDGLGKMGSAAARNHGVRLAREVGAEWLFFLDARHVLAVEAFAHVADKLHAYDAIWGAIHELDDDELHGAPRAGQLLQITRIDEVLGNAPFNTLQIGHFVRTAVASAMPFDPGLDAAEFDYYLRLWSKYRCVKIERPFYYHRRAAAIGEAHVVQQAKRRAAAEKVICDKCVALDYHADFAHRGENFQFCITNPFDLIQGNFLKGRFFEMRELAAVEQWVGTGAAIVEVGAYVGNHVVYYARFMQPRSILVLEPNPEAIALLRRNLETNKVATADLSRLGIGAAAAVSTYDLVCEAAANRGATRLVQTAAGAVKTAPLDELIAGTVDFIKIDVEGMELEVLDGAARIIAALRPKIMIEVFRSQIPRFDAWLRQYRYIVRQQFDYVHAVNYLIEPANA